MRSFGAWALAAALGLAGCSILPDDGPSPGAVSHGAGAAGPKHYAMVNVDYRVVQVLADHPATPLASLPPPSSDAPNDLIRIGDALSVSIYQPGISPLVSSGLDSSSSGSANEALPHVLVDRDGAVAIPFAGRVKVDGLDPAEASDAIRRALIGKMVSPQVILSVLTSPANSVTVIGQVRNSGRFPVSAHNDHLLDAIAAAGGVGSSPADLLVSVARGGQSATIPMAQLMSNPAQNIRLAPGDLVQVTTHTRKVDMFGALGHVSEVPIVDDTLSLAGALGRAGGLNSFTAEPSSVYLFRFERPEVAKALGIEAPPAAASYNVPVVYRLNLRDPSGYFLATKFQVAPDDLIDAPRADLAEFQKFFLLVSTASTSFYYYTLIGLEAPKL